MGSEGGKDGVLLRDGERSMRGSVVGKHHLLGWDRKVDRDGGRWEGAKEWEVRWSERWGEGEGGGKVRRDPLGTSLTTTSSVWGAVGVRIHLINLDEFLQRQGDFFERSRRRRAQPRESRRPL